MNVIARITTSHPSYTRFSKIERTYLSLVTNKSGKVDLSVRIENAQKLLAAVQKGIVCNEQAILTGLTPLTSHQQLGALTTQILELLKPEQAQASTAPPIITPPLVVTPASVQQAPTEEEPPTVRLPITPPAPSQIPTLPPAARPAPAAKQPSLSLKAFKWLGYVVFSPVLLPYLILRAIIRRLTTPNAPTYASTTKGAAYTSLHIGLGLGGFCSVNGRANNEDAAAIDGLYLRVFDGMGGHNGGEVAADIAVHKTRQAYLSRTQNRSLNAAEALFFADEAIKFRAQTQPANAEPLSGMGAAAATIFIEGKKAQVAWAGDARLYILRGGELLLRTVDNHKHTLQWGAQNGKVKELVDLNGATAYPFDQAETADYHEFTMTAQGEILNPLGHLNGPENVSRSNIELKPGDTLLLSTDGLHGFISFDVLRNLLINNAHLPAARRAQLLAEVALEHMREAGKEGDNTTVIIADLVADKKGDLAYRSTPAKAALQVVLPGEQNPTRIASDSITYHAENTRPLRSVELAEPKIINNIGYQKGTVLYFSPEGKLISANLSAPQNLGGPQFLAGDRVWFNEQGELQSARLGSERTIHSINFNAGTYLFYENDSLIGAELYGEQKIFGLFHPHRTKLNFAGNRTTVRLKLANGNTRNINGIDYSANSRLVYDSTTERLVEARFFGSLTLPHLAEPVTNGSWLVFSATGEIGSIELGAHLNIYGTDYPPGSKVILDNLSQQVSSIIIGADMGETKAGAQLWFSDRGETIATKYNQEITIFDVKFLSGAILKTPGDKEIIVPSADLPIGDFLIGSGLELEINEDDRSFILTVPSDPTKLVDASNAFANLPADSRIEISSYGTVISITPAGEWEGVAAGNTVYLKNDGNWDVLEVKNQQKIGDTTWLAGSVLFFNGDKISSAKAKAGQEIDGWRIKADLELKFDNDGNPMIPVSVCERIAVSQPAPAPAIPTAPAARFTLAPTFDINDIKSVRNYLRALGALADVEGELTDEEETIVKLENERLEQIKQQYVSDSWINMQCIASRTKILELLMG